MDATAVMSTVTGNAAAATPETQFTFKRYELKYLLSADDRDDLLRSMRKHMQGDAYGQSHVSNVYFDTPSFLLARRSVEGGVYKEKLRVRGYGEVGPASTVFVEVKKKFDGVVYKRRVTRPLAGTLEELASGEFRGTDQISSEIDYLVRRYETLAPAIFLAYDRCAYVDRKSGEFRLTLDQDIRWRDWDLAFDGCREGHDLLQPGMTLMELKTGRALPLWMVDFLGRREVMQSSFSKYGRAYLEREGLLVPRPAMGLGTGATTRVTLPEQARHARHLGTVVTGGYAAGDFAAASTRATDTYVAGAHDKEVFYA